MPPRELLRDATGLMERVQPFLVVGAIKSGTTWVQLLLDAHPEISCRGEGHVLSHLKGPFQEILSRYNRLLIEKNTKVFPTLPDYPLLDREQALALLRAVQLLQYSRIADMKGPQVRAVGDKTPDYAAQLPLIHEMLPEARIIHVVRDGRDAAVSAWHHNMRLTPEWAIETYGTVDGFALFFADVWVNHAGAAETFAAAHPDLCLTVRYEALKTRPADELTRILSFLDITAPEETIAACLAATRFETLSGGRKPGDDDGSSLFRKGVVGDHASALKASTIAGFGQKAGSLLRQLGYAP